MFNSKTGHSNPFTRMSTINIRNFDTVQDSLAPNENGQDISPTSEVSPLSKLELSPPSFSMVRRSEQKLFETALEYPALVINKDKKYTTIPESDEEDSPLFPTWNEKIEVGGMKLPMANKDGFNDDKDGNDQGIFKNYKTGANLLSSLTNGSPFQNIKSFPTKEKNPDEWFSSSLDNYSIKGSVPSPDRSFKNSKTASGSLTKENVDHSVQLPIVDKHRGGKIVISIILLILLGTAPLIMVVLGSSCKTSDGVCFPQYSVTWNESSPQAEQALSAARELWKVVSYIAIDMGSPSNESDTLFTDENYLNTVDTFSYDNIYGMSYNGYCRDNLITGTRFCTECHGMDVISTLIRDAGIQLAKVAHRDDFKTVGESFVLAYKIILKNFDNGNNNELLAQKAKLMSTVAEILTELIDISLVLSIGITLYLVLIILLIIFQKPNKLIKRLKLLILWMILLQFIEIAIIFTISSIEIEFIYSLLRTLSLFGIAIITYDLGIYILLLSLLISMISFIICLIFLKLVK